MIRRSALRPISSVHVDLTRLTFEVSQIQNDAELGRWLRDLVRCLALRDPSLHVYGAHLLAEVAEYRAWENERKRPKTPTDSHGFPRNPRYSADSLRQTEQSRSDQNRTEKEKQPPSPLRGEFEKVRKRYPGTKRGEEVEWKNFEKKYRPRLAEIVPLLAPAVERICRDVSQGKKELKFVPHFQSWINQERWTEEPAMNGVEQHSTPKPYNPLEI